VLYLVNDGGEENRSDFYRFFVCIIQYDIFPCPEYQEAGTDSI